MRVLVAMSGGVDSSVAAAVLRDAGHHVDGATLRLWGGTADSGCCSVADVDDARRVAQQLGIDHYVFNMANEFEDHVVTPYVESHRTGQTPNPCIECNRHIKFDQFARRAWRLGYDAIATGHHVRRVAIEGPSGIHPALGRAVDADKDQSYVVHMIERSVLERCLFPIGDLTKADVRSLARSLDLRTADKAESQDVCFIAKAGGGRRGFLASRIELHPARILDSEGHEIGTTDAVELVTVGQRKGLGQLGVPEARYVTDVDLAARTVTIGERPDLLVDEIRLGQVVVSVPRPWGTLRAQASAHGAAFPVAALIDPERASASLRCALPQRRVAPGQTVVLYDGDVVVAGGVVT